MCYLYTDTDTINRVRKERGKKFLLNIHTQCKRNVSNTKHICTDTFRIKIAQTDFSRVKKKTYKQTYRLEIL